MSDRRQFLSSLLLEQEHEKHLRRAIALRANNPRAPYAAVPVDAAKNEIVAEGWNKSPQNPLLHGGNGYHQSRRRTAAGDRLGGTRAVHDRRTVSAEPYPMCMDAALWAGIPTIVYGSSIPLLTA